MLRAREPIAPTPLEHELLRELAVARFGLDLPRQRRAALGGRLRPRLDACGATSVGEYCELLRHAAPGADEWGLFADAITNAETYFFRAHGQLEELVTVIDRFQDHRLRVLSAGCSSGEEAYSIAALLATHADALPRGFDVVGVDISTPRLAEACVARYSGSSFRDPHALPGAAAQFERAGDAWSPRAALRTHVTFHLGNLAHPDGLRLGRFDVIFCRNVLIYAHPAAWSRFLRTLADALAPDGLLFLGDSEFLLGKRTPFASRRLRHHFAYVHAA